MATSTSLPTADIAEEKKEEEPSEMKETPLKAETDDASKPAEDAKVVSLEKEPPPKRRRPSRATNNLRLPEAGCLQSRRLAELFFRETDEASNKKFGNVCLQQVHQSPNIYVIDDFLTASELEHLQTKINKGKFSRSFVDASESSTTTYDTQHRTSTFLSFAKRHDSKIAAIEDKAAALLGYYSSVNVEPLQLVRYVPGQFFGIHHDMADLEDDGSVALPPKTPYSKRRLVTIFCYLNETDQGGCTYFPQANDLRVAPKAGRAVVFCNATENGLPDPRTVHAGEEVREGCKYGLNIWLCEE